MRFMGFVLSVPLLGLACCTQSPSQSPVRNETAEPQSVPATPAGPAARAETKASPSDDRTPLAEPKGPIDPKSAEAAGQVVQHYGALIEARRFAQAEKLWGDANSASAFTLQLKRYPEAHLEIGKPGDAEGAAGSIYLTEPVTFYGKDQNSANLRRSANVILRRVNDVPGSTDVQRRWHIERIEWKDKA